LEKPERKVDLVAQAHALKLRQSKEAAEKSRLSFVAQHLDLFKPFLSSGLLSKAEAARSSRNLVPQHKQYSQQPACIDKKAVTMRPYQIEGINFMMKMHHNGMGCVLADEMGLGMFNCFLLFVCLFVCCCCCC
jgi:SWI/SNF-related matrix-associated actin-dependent regulator of chromatin subfamily A member 5